MKRLFLASAVGAAFATAAAAQEEVKVGIILGFTGPLESITPAMAEGAELALAEASEGSEAWSFTAVRADSTCIDASAATAAAERLVSAEGVSAMVGADCSGVSTAIANSVAVPKGVVMVSPSSTSASLSAIDDDGYFFRTAPSDVFQGPVIADILAERGVDTIAISYTNNDYGKGLSDAIATAFEAIGGAIPIIAPHEDGKGDYTSDVAALQASGAEHLVVAGYVDQGGAGIVQAALDTGAFESFIFPDGMYGQSLIDAAGGKLNGKVVGTLPGTPLTADFEKVAQAAGLDPTAVFVPQSYDAAALIALATAAAGGPGSPDIRDKMIEVANAPGEPIRAGEIAKGMELLAAGQDIDYVGASGVELIGPGDSGAAYRVYEIRDDAAVTIGYR